MRIPIALHPGHTRSIHRHAWLWEPLENEATLVLRTMFGAKAVYLDGRLMLCFSAGEEPWCGMLVCTDRERQAALRAEFPRLAPHPVLSKWLYLPEATTDFDCTAERLVKLAHLRDPRIGVAPRPRRPSRRARAQPRPD